jgi:peptide/nickel transport system ATP-binding protein
MTVTSNEESSPVVPVLAARDLEVRHRSGDRDVALVRGSTFDVGPGEIVCLVGESGSGKSLTAGAVSGLVQRDKRLVVRGTVTFEGQDLTGLDQRRLRQIRGREIGMIFQDPVGSLDPVMPVGRQVAEAVARGRTGRAAIRRRVLELIAQVGISDPEHRATQYPHEISGGMCQRVAIAIAIAADPKLLVADEPTTALDVTIQAQVLDLLQRICDERAMSVLLITHDMGVAAQTADRIIVMYAGAIVEEGPTADVFARPGHPYSVGLIRSVPRVDGTPMDRLPAIPGSMPEARDRPAGCAFHPRCPFAIDRCRQQAPALVPIGRRRVACHRAHELRSGSIDREAPDSGPFDGTSALADGAADSGAGEARR